MQQFYFLMTYSDTGKHNYYLNGTSVDKVLTVQYGITWGALAVTQDTSTLYLSVTVTLQHISYY